MSKKCILCVKDHKDICELISTILKHYEVVNSPSATDALHLAKLNKFNLYVLDCNLPNKAGFELAALIRNFDTETPILLTTDTNSISQKQAIQSGAQGVLNIGTVTWVKDLENRVAQILESNSPAC
jgi:CheY-like chemotaxis protein